jgi:Tfp pilus assembly PilM family ATPase
MPGSFRDFRRAGAAHRPAPRRLSMFFAPKTKFFHACFTEHNVLLARVSAAGPPLVIEDIREVAADDEAALAEAIKALQPKKTGSYLQAVCGVFPPRRIVRRVTLEPKRVREAGYLNEIVSQQLRIEPEQHTLMLLHPGDGVEFDSAQTSQKDVVVCGLPAEDVIATQDKLLAAGLYPDRLELGTVATIGALADCLSLAKAKAPVLMLEIGADSTQSFIVSASGLETARAIPQGLDGMIPVVQKELTLSDEEAARKMFYSNAFDFTGLAPLLTRKLLKELQSYIGFYEVQTGQSIGQVICPLLPNKLGWLEAAVAAQLSVDVFKPDLPAWLQSRQITLAEPVAAAAQDAGRVGLFALIAQYNRHAALPEKAA